LLFTLIPAIPKYSAALRKRNDASERAGKEWSGKQGLGKAMSNEENEKHLERIVYREAFEPRNANAAAARNAMVSDAKPSMKFASLKMWLRVRDRIGPSLDNLNRNMSSIGSEVRLSKKTPHDDSHLAHPSIGRSRVDLFQDGRITTRSLEVDLSESGVVHVYMYLPKETYRTDIPIAEVDDERIEAVLLNFVDLATRDDVPLAGAR
jgi:hypothetical protein